MATQSSNKYDDTLGELRASRVGLLAFAALLFVSTIGFLTPNPNPATDEGRYLIAGAFATATLATVVVISAWGPLRRGEVTALAVSTVPFFTFYIPTVATQLYSGAYVLPYRIILVVSVLAFGVVALLAIRSVLGLWGAPPFRFLDARLAYGDSWRYTVKHDWDRAIETAEQAVRLCPRAPGTHDALGYAYAGAGDFDRAVQAYRTGLSICPDDPVLLADLGLVNANAGAHEEAASAYQRVLTLGADSPSLRYSLALAYDRLGRVDEAIVQARRALEMAPGNLIYEEFLRELERGHPPAATAPQSV